MNKADVNGSRITLPRLSPRLSAIYNMTRRISDQQGAPDIIWDCCCDHGYLGMHILNAGLADTIRFVDQLPHIIERLAGQLALQPHTNYETITASVADLQPEADRQHLIILAGIGGEIMAQLMSHLTMAKGSYSAEYIFCASATQFDIREYLNRHNFLLKEEQFIVSGKQSYELIYCATSTTDHGQPVSLTGNMWQQDNPDHVRYLNMLHDHYQRMHRYKPDDWSHKAVRAYNTLINELNIGA